MSRIPSAFAPVLSVVLCMALWMPARMEAQAGAGQGLARAMESVRTENWAAAQIEAGRDGQEAQDLVLWHFLRSGDAENAQQVLDFITRNPDWPGLPYLKEKSEAAMETAPADVVLPFFKDHIPRTGTGALALARAHRQAGDIGAAEAAAIHAWTHLTLVQDEREALMSAWGAVLKPYHTARMDHALWSGWSVNARAMLGQMNDGWRALALARIALRKQEGNVDTLIANVPAALKNDAGLAYERFLWRYRKGRRASAIELMLERSDSEESLGRPELWAKPRVDLARRRMLAGAHREAYRIAANHHMSAGSDFRELEWLAGYIALRHLNDAKTALPHFQAYLEDAETPIAVGRGGYWVGRAHEALGGSDAARAAYARAAEFQTSFYGLLAAERADLPFDTRLSGKEAFAPWRSASYTNSSVYRAAILLLSAQEYVLAERFLTHLAEELPREEIGQMGAMLAEMNQPHIQVMVGKRAARFGIEIPGPYYALYPSIVSQKHPVPTEMVLAIARRESEFDPVVVSHAGARGLMQLMPGTAQLMAGELGVSYSLNRLTADPRYNYTLGAAYLADVSRRFNGNVVMMSAAYNAGPGRPARWMDQNGDPRRGGIDIVDWIEAIPFDETRNYVMRVAESLPVYRARLGVDPLPVPFSQELIGSTLRVR